MNMKYLKMNCVKSKLKLVIWRKYPNSVTRRWERL